MFPPITALRQRIAAVIKSRGEQGHVTDGLDARLADLSESYDELLAFASELSRLPMRADWPYVEPSDLAGIRAESDPSRPTAPVADVDLDRVARHVEAAFLGSVCGCVLGKPLEVNPTLEELRAAFEPLGEWPIRDYVPEAAIDRLGRRHHSWEQTVRERIAYVASDDDINYTVLGTLLLERHGSGFTREDLRFLWARNIAPMWSFGPERKILTDLTAASLFGREQQDDATFDSWVTTLNPMDEFCGAQIRADAYGYACPGDPEKASELAYRDASFTHRRTGIYATMFTAAAVAVALCPPSDDPTDVFEQALRYVPRRSRFHHIVADSLQQARQASDWVDGYRRIHGKYAEYSHCRVYQETGTLINTLRFAGSVGDGICKQVMQGNDTDSYGATAGNLLGCWFGPGHLEERWLAPFGNRIHVALSSFHEQRLDVLSKRIGQLPRRVREIDAERARSASK
jgi:ADP-ribosylglycohydrolase